MRERSLGQLAEAAARGDERAWTELVRRVQGALRSVIRGYRLDPADVEDVLQATWMRALGSLHRLNEPEAVAGWLIVTARREALRTLQRGVRELVTDDARLLEPADHAAAPDAAVIERERGAAVHAAVRRLHGRQRRLMESMLEQGPSYEQISHRLEMPVGSIGPTRDRAIARLRTDEQLLAALS
jgi:RNA polymerase sigma factor (sigma-70 family)